MDQAESTSSLTRESDVSVSWTPRGYALIGAGDFGKFSLSNLRSLEGVRPVAVMDTDRAAAESAAAAFDLIAETELNPILENPDIDLVHVATPPFTHYDLVRQLLEADKHVLCEKPLTLTAAQAEELIEQARQRARLCVPNFLLRYNPLVEWVRRVVISKILGAPVRASFENLAGNSKLGPDHWFWDPAKSGGIFIEHGVHFFDAFDSWLGHGSVQAADVFPHEATGLPDQVHCVLQHPSGVFSFHYHGFIRPADLELQRWRVEFERGSVELEGWIPLNASLRGDTEFAKVLELAAQVEDLALGNLRIQQISDHPPFLEAHLRWDCSKADGYGSCFRALMRDQLFWLENPAHQRIVTENDGLRAVQVAESAATLARERARSK